LASARRASRWRGRSLRWGCSQARCRRVSIIWRAAWWRLSWPLSPGASARTASGATRAARARRGPGSRCRPASTWRAHRPPSRRCGWGAT
jgi:hypothetical protein